MTFGQTKTLFEKLDKTAFKLPANGNELDNLARMFGAKNLKTLNNWLALIRDVRNRCAHHSRTWNANYREPHQIWSMLNNNYLPAHKNRIYLCIAMMHHIDNNLGMSLNLKHKLQTLFSKYPIALQHAKAAGFPQNWDKDSFWD